MTAVSGRAALRLGVVGKGGVGKTTVSGLLASAYAGQGRLVVAIDTDSNPNLGMSLGLSLAETEAVPVLPRTSVLGTGGTHTAQELIEAYGRQTPSGVTLLSAIKVAEAGAGCTCSGHAVVRSLLGQALLDIDVTLVDMEAGLEHLSRSGGTLAHADVLLVVCEPTRKSVLTAARTLALADELGIAHVLGLGNKSQDQQDVDFFVDAFLAEGIALGGVLPYDPAVAAADRADVNTTQSPSPELRSALEKAIAAVDATQALAVTS